MKNVLTLITFSILIISCSCSTQRKLQADPVLNVSGLLVHGQEGHTLAIGNGGSVSWVKYDENYFDTCKFELDCLTGKPNTAKIPDTIGYGITLQGDTYNVVDTSRGFILWNSGSGDAWAVWGPRVEMNGDVVKMELDKSFKEVIINGKRYKLKWNNKTPYLTLIP